MHNPDNSLWALVIIIGVSFASLNFTLVVLFTEMFSDPSAGIIIPLITILLIHSFIKVHEGDNNDG